jgi:glycosyltransferase involved in cell wall biosynthesis
VLKDPEAVAKTRILYATNGAPLLGHMSGFGDPITALLWPTLERTLAAHPDLRAVLMGSGSRESRDRFVASRPEFASRVFATGPLRPEDLSISTSACDLMLQPYPDGVTTRRTSAMLALAHSRALVTTTGPLSEPLWARSGAVALAAEGDTRGLAEATLALANDCAARRALAGKGNELYARKFDLHHTICALRAG